jgi:hypothetical protein
MQRGVYFDGWYPNQHNYHPSLPPRRLKMIDDLVEMRATMLVWSALGGGSISLPYLEHEAHGVIPERFRMYGYLNDAEFIEAAQARGIDVFGIVFECQGWEFPADVTDGVVTGLNETRAPASSWLGLREFTQDSGPADWAPFTRYFPNGLRNSRGETVTDLWEEGACRDLEGNALHAHWVEAPDRAHQNHYMDRNNPVWREYMKAIIRIQIDAGVAGVQLDETDTPLGAMRYGGCFCKDCVAQFREYLQETATATRDPELLALPLDTFDYGAWLRAQGFHAGDSPRTMPLYHHYCRFQVRAVNRTFAEMADYIHEYGESVGRHVKVAGNFYNCFPEHDAMVGRSDVLVTEMKITGLRQPWWFRHAAAFGQGKDVAVVENPYGGVVPSLVEDLDRGRAYDRFRVSIYEGAAMGASMTLPYGSWLGSEIEHSFWAPKALAREVGEFLEAVDPLRSATSANDLAVLYSVSANMQSEIDGDKWDDQGKFFDTELEAAPATGYWDVVERLDDARHAYDAVILPDPLLRENDLTAERLARYSAVVIAGCSEVSTPQHAAIVAYLDGGGTAVIRGDYATNLDPEQRAAVTDHDRAETITDLDALVAALPRAVCIETSGTVSVNLADLGDRGRALHIVNYDFDEDRDAAVPHHDVEVVVPAVDAGDGAGVGVGVGVGEATLHRPGAAPEPLEVTETADGLRVVVPTLETYAVVHFG